MNDQLPHPLTPQDCLVAVMIAIAASDEDMRTAELVKIESTINNLPIFAAYDLDRLRVMSQTVFDLFSVEDGLDALFGLIRENLPELSTRPPMRWPAISPPPTARSTSANCACWKRCATSSISTGCTPRRSSAGRARDI